MSEGVTGIPGKRDDLCIHDLPQTSLYRDGA